MVLPQRRTARGEKSVALLSRDQLVQMLNKLDIELGQIPISPIPAVNVAAVPQRSPLRYPGGKTWLIPHVRAWLSGMNPRPELLVEPFAGGGIVSLTAIMEGWVSRCLMAEIDRDVAAFWQAALWHSEDLINRVQTFVPTRESIAQLQQNVPDDVVTHGFQTLVLNRTRRGGILANGASLARVGEAGKGVTSRWYPDTISRRIRAIAKHADRIEFRQTDGLELLEQLLIAPDGSTAVFVDPPYTAAGKGAGKRLYNHNVIDHPGLFHCLAQGEADFLMTYDQSPEVIAMTQQYGFHVMRVNMKNTHHAKLWELLITRREVF